MFNQYPYLNENDLNLDYLLRRMKNLEQTVAQFVALETVTFSDPIKWDITKQYPKSNIVLDNSGDAYLSKQAVPAGVQLSNTDYWLEIFNFTAYIKAFDSNLTYNIEQNTERASKAYIVGDWLLIDDILYKVIAAISADELFVIDTNIERFTVEDFIKAWINYANGLIVQYKNDIDASELAYKNAIDASELEFTTNLTNLFNQAVAGVTVDSEVLLSRVGWNGFTYSTLADALHAQIGGIIKGIIGNDLLPESVRISQLKNCIYLTDNLYDKDNVESGRIDENGFITSNASYVSTDYIKVEPSTEYYVYGTQSNGTPYNARSVAEYDENCNLIAQADYVETSFTTSATTAYVRMTIDYSRRNSGYLGTVARDNASRDYDARFNKDFINYDFAANDSAVASLTAESNKHVTNFVQIPIPSAFTWQNSPIKDKLHQDFKGNCYCNLDIEDYKNVGGRTYYVDYLNGDDSNNGLVPANAFKTMNKAYTQIDIDTMILLPGVFPSNGNLRAVPITKNINIIGIGDVYIDSSTPLDPFTQTAGYSYIYEQPAGTVLDLYDITGKDKNGDVWKYTKVTSLAECEALPASYYHAGGILYVHCFDDRAPQLRELWRTSDMTAFTIEGSCNVYLENLTIFGGETCIRAHAESVSDIINVYANKCAFMGSKNNSYDAVMMQGTTLTIFKDCKALYSKKDGFNYHERGGIIPKAIEINCTGKYNGTSGESSHQGSTIHDGGSIIRINGVYNDNCGSNIADQGTNTESFNINCVCYNSKANYNSQNVNYYAYNDVTMFVDSCVGFSSYYNVGGAGNKYVRNYHFTGELSAVGEEPTIY